MVKKVISLFLCAVIALAFTSCVDEKQKDNQADEETPELVYNVVDSAYLSYDASAVSAYADLCKAVTNGENSFRFNVGLFDDVMQLFYTSFPLSSLVKDIKINKDNSGVLITYNFSEEETKQKAAAFANKVYSIVKECKKDGGKRAYAIRAYNYTATHFKVVDGSNITLYDTFMKGEGSTSTCSGVLEYLLRQGGINSAHLLANDAAGNAWSLCLAELDGENYLFDPVTETIANGGKQLVYFGMTNEDAGKEGLSNFVYTSKAEAPMCDNPYFDACRKCNSWEISDGGNSLLITQNSEDIVQIAL